ncbi:MAG TPA: S8 family serine peptidase [Candidatus Udaeobacter sp.]|nr:S8 family serine peptidase [Candidatus Udaeobacter sp.]
MKKILVVFLISSSIALSMIAFGVGKHSVTTRPNPNADTFGHGPAVDTSSVIVQLKGDPLSTSSVTKPVHGQKIDFNSNAVRSYRAQLKAARNEFKQWLRSNAPAATVTSEYDIALNGVAVELNGTPLATIAAAPMVQQAAYDVLYHPDLSQSYKIINAMDAWNAAGGRSVAGAGIKIGDIDTGIDETHPFFDSTGFSYPSGFPKCDAIDSNSHQVDRNCKYVSPKVIVAKVFYGKAREEGVDAQAIQDHGSHTAGIAAGVTGKTAVVNGVNVDDMSGIAPGAWLGNYNVFPGDVENARSKDILSAVEAAVEDGMDVLNLSLGGDSFVKEENDLLALGLNNAVDAGVVVAVAAGNSGPGRRTVESPGRASKVITVAASTNQHFVGQPITYPAGGGTTVGGAVGDFDPLAAQAYNLFDTHSDGCTSVDPGASGKLALIDRGTCSFSQKIANAKTAGAIGVIIINNVAGDPIAMARTAGFDDDLPAVMISKNDGAALRASGATTASADATFQEFITEANKDILAGFSSQGPTNADLAIKPDVTSVGVNVLSSITCVNKGPGCPGDGSGWAFFQGTSMSTPHIAGSAAVLLELHPDWSPAQIKSALVNRAELVIKDAVTGTHDVGPRAQGAGRENLSVAADATTWMDPASASFGKVPGNSPSSVNITLYNPTGSNQTFSVSTTKFTPDSFGGTVDLIYNAGILSAGDDRVTVPSSVTVPANGSTTLTVTVNGGLTPHSVVQGWINLDGDGTNDLHFAYAAQVGPE